MKSKQSVLFSLIGYLSPLVNPICVLCPFSTNVITLLFSMFTQCFTQTQVSLLRLQDVVTNRPYLR